MKRKTQTWTAIGFAAVTVAGVLYFITRRQQEERQRLEEESAVDFIDASAHRLTVMLNYVDPQIERLRGRVDQLKQMRALYEQTEFRQQFGRHMMELDEDVTKLMIHVDGVDLTNASAEVKGQRRERLIKIQELANEVLAL
jgi:hypothetical protein